MSADLLARIRVAGRVPRHVAVIMDGNGRWARQRGLPRHEGHRRGMNAVREVVSGAVEAGIGVLTLYAFSTQNWDRPAAEIGALMNLLRVYARKEGAGLRDQGVEVHILGELERIDESTLDTVRELERITRGGDRLRLNLMISYSGRRELVRAAQRLARAAVDGTLSPEEIDDDALEGALFTAGLPDPDLLVRSSGEQRISNFLLWQLAYTEIHTSPVLWPEFTREDLFRAILDYQSRERRFGRVEAT